MAQENDKEHAEFREAIAKMLQENYKIMTEITKFTPRYSSQGLKFFER